ncbi:uncharacterized protein E0L32_008159 [Thyridium curvatum]|uniref:tRNA dimethylallyltransferase n=1 Tax=Thyridium curvatum TaxID=1093900 RepID=A0A507AT80_9PEZI|nr:uncharacterized protein E0L32_008159 [Thyridium curvatum]TPX10953.1 hypothetical protein E0L32_008159 [Thyridium curvatum]
MAAQRPKPPMPLVVIMGTTGTGKSDVSVRHFEAEQKIPGMTDVLVLFVLVIQLAVELACRFNGEIVNADAMQMYRGLPVITNKISAREQRGIPHHLFDQIGLEEETWDAGVFKREAGKLISEIRQRGKLPIVVGGTHYYVNALLFNQSLVEETSEAAPPGADTLTSNGRITSPFPVLDGPTDAMLARLREVDPVMADRWHPNDRRKIRRSLEIFLTTGKRASDIYAEQQREQDAKSASAERQSSWQTLLFWVYSTPDILNGRLDRRVDKMLETGLLEETKEMHDYLNQRLRRGEEVDRSKGIWQSIGFKQVEPYLEGLARDMDPIGLEKVKQQSLEDVKTATRRYAKYQIRWITKKTVPPLRQEGAMDHLYLLDSSDVSQWPHKVAGTAADITSAYLEGKEMPMPSSISETAAQVLSSTVTASTDKGTPCRKTCEVCNVTALTEELWAKHLKGRSHRAMVRHKKRVALVVREEVDESSHAEEQGRDVEEGVAGHAASSS